MTALRFLAGLAVGWATSQVILEGGFALLRASWPDYALAEPGKEYTSGMLFVRLVLFSSMIVATSGVAALVGGHERVAWAAGGLILAFSIPPHLYPGTVWDDYPAWYHVAYLLSILPLAILGGRATRSLGVEDSAVALRRRRIP